MEQRNNLQQVPINVSGLEFFKDQFLKKIMSPKKINIQHGGNCMDDKYSADKSVQNYDYEKNRND